MPNSCRNASLLAIGLIAVLELACGGSSSPEGAGGSSGSGGASGAGGGTAGVSGAGGGGTTCPGAAAMEAAAPTCNTVTNSAAAIPYTAGTGSAPVAAGGTILDGLYEATKTEAWGNATPSGRKITIVISGTKWMWVGETRDATGANVTSSFRGNVIGAVSGSQITFTAACSTVPLPTTPMTFTATANEIKLMYENTAAGYTAVTTYTRKGCP